jgi:hypothetical protein
VLDSTEWLWPAGGFVAAAALVSTIVLAVLSLRGMRGGGRNEWDDRDPDPRRPDDSDAP